MANCLGGRNQLLKNYLLENNISFKEYFENKIMIKIIIIKKYKKKKWLNNSNSCIIYQDNSKAWTNEHVLHVSVLFGKLFGAHQFTHGF